MLMSTIHSAINYYLKEKQNHKDCFGERAFPPKYSCIFSFYWKSCSLSPIRHPRNRTPPRCFPRACLRDFASLPGIEPEGAHPSSFRWDQGGRVGLILNRATSSPAVSSGKEPSIKDINKLQVFRNLPAAL